MQRPWIKIKGEMTKGVESPHRLQCMPRHFYSIRKVGGGGNGATSCTMNAAMRGNSSSPNGVGRAKYVMGRKECNDAAVSSGSSGSMSYDICPANLVSIHGI
jgi:hypothetical protein